MRNVTLPRSLALLLVVASCVAASGAAAAQTVRLEPARIDGNPLFSQSTTSFSGRPLTEGMPAGAAVPVALDSLQHALIDVEGAADTLLVVVGNDASGAQRVFAGRLGGALLPVVPDTTRTARPVAVATLAAPDGSQMLFDVSPRPGFLLFRRLDARVGQVEIGGAVRDVAVMRAPGSATFAVGPDLFVFVDADGDGVLTGAAGVGGGGR